MFDLALASKEVGSGLLKANFLLISSRLVLLAVISESFEDLVVAVVFSNLEFELDSMTRMNFSTTVEDSVREN